jgi:hypothetical protein
MRRSRDGAGLPEEGDLALVLDHAQFLDRVPGGAQLRRVVDGLDLGMAFDGDVVRLERQPSHAVLGGPGGQGDRGGPGDDQLQVGADPLGGAGIAGVGAQHGGAARADQQRGVGTVEPGQIADVDQPRDQYGVGVGRDAAGEGLPAPLMLLPHKEQLIAIPAPVTPRRPFP